MIRATKIPSFNELMTRKTKRFIKNNRQLYRLFIGFMLFMGPIAGAAMLFFAPLLGYLFVTAEGFWVHLGLSAIIAAFSLIVVQFYFIYWQSSELQFLQLNMNQKAAFFAHLKVLIQRSIIFHFVILAAFYRIDVDLKSVLYVVLAYSIFIAIFCWRYRNYLGNQSRFQETLSAYVFMFAQKIRFVRIKTVLLLMSSGGWLRLLLVFGTYALLFKLANSPIAWEYSIGIGLALLSLNLFFVRQTFKIILLNIQRTEMFWLTLGPAVLASLYSKAKVFSMALVVINILIIVVTKTCPHDIS